MKPVPANCRLPLNRLEELQCYKLLQAIRADDYHLITELTVEGVERIVDICEPKSGIFPLQLAVELNKLALIDTLFKLGAAANTCDLSGKTATMMAAELGLYKALDRLISHGADIGQVDNNQHDTLCYCLTEGPEPEDMLRCLNLCLEMDEKHYKHSLSLLLAIEKGEPGLGYAQEILHHMTNPNVMNYVNKRTALSYACEFNPTLVADLLKKGADASQADVKSNSPVHYAAKSGSGVALQALSAYAVDFNTFNSDGQNPFHTACDNDKAKVVKFLAQRGSNPKVKDKKGNFARSLCKKKTLKDVKKAERAYGKRPEPSQVIFKDWLHAFELDIETFVPDQVDCDEIVHIFYTQMEVKPPIPQAETESYISKISKNTSSLKKKDLWKPGRLVSKLYEAPGRKKKKGKKGKKKKAKTRKPIKGNMAISIGPPGLARRQDGGPPHNLVERVKIHTDLERFNRENKPRHPFQDDSAWYLEFPGRDLEWMGSIIKHGDMTSLEFALKNGCPINIKDRFYKTALMHAATAGQVDTVNMLLKRGADSAERDNMGWTALHHAVSSGGLGVTKALVESGADIHAKTANGATVLMRAAQGSQAPVIEYLLAQGAGGKKIFVQNKKEQTVIDVAEQWCDYDSYKMLKDHFDSIKPPKEKRGKPKPKPKAKPSGAVVVTPKTIEPTIDLGTTKLMHLPDAEQLKLALEDSEAMASATSISKEALRRNAEQWSSAPRTAQLLQRRKEIRQTPAIIENVHRIWAKNQIMPSNKVF